MATPVGRDVIELPTSAPLALRPAPAYTPGRMSAQSRVLRTTGVLGFFALASFFAVRHGPGGLWRGLEIAHAVTSPGRAIPPYDLTQLGAVNATLDLVIKKYVDPGRVRPRQMFLSALDEVQKEVARVIVLHDEKSPTVKVKVENESREFRVDNVQGPWDVAARLREVFAFLQERLAKDPDLDLREVEYAACNGMLRTLDPHSVFLSPEAFKDMNTSTSGHFGGLGIVISIRDQQLTVMRPMPETPAGRAGLKRFDRIAKINNESTLNMPIDDAVTRLRGKPGSRVTVWVHRDGSEGWAGVRPFELLREEIRIRSVDSRQLGDGIGYVRIKQFQSTTAEELQEALVALGRPAKLRGLVLDLRGNPGGLLEQAARVVDAFIEEGTIVSTVGGHEPREDRKAARDGSEPAYPIVALVNGSSASASEIVAGALKNLDRAIIVGQTTFGKGSVQVVTPLKPDNAAVKLTISRYLTPGSVSIQGVGVTPDFELDPMTAALQEMDLFRTDNQLRERDLTKSLASSVRKSSDRSAYTLRYALSEAQRRALLELGGEVDDDFTLDYPIQFAKSLAAESSGAKRSDQVAAAKALVARAQSSQLEAISSDLKALGIDWAAPPADAKAGPKAGDYVVEVRTNRKGDSLTAGETATLEVSVENKSKVPIYQLRATTKSDNLFLDEKELVFGRIDPGKKRTATAPLGWCQFEGRKIATTAPLPDNAKRICRIPAEAATRQDIVKVRFSAEGGEAPVDGELRPTVQSQPRPVFAYSYQIVDNRPGNGDGQLERGEGATVFMTVKNAGRGPAPDTQASLRNLAGDGLLLHAGRFELGKLEPGEERQVAFTFDVLDTVKDDTAKVELSVVDRELRVVSSEKLVIPVIRGGLAMKPASGRVWVPGGARVLPQPFVTATPVGDLVKGAVVDRLGTFGEFTKVRVLGERFGWIPTAGASDAGARPVTASFETSLRRSPPILELKPTALSTTEERIKLSGVATDGDRLLDVFVFVGNRKVFYAANSKAADPKKMEFELNAPLTPGVNIITVVARENEDTVTRSTVVIRRDGPGGTPLPTPKNELFGEGWEFDGAD